ncbi:hypothetical protein BJY21_001270 [Kineosphaera limosa]|uniref:Uncharacterized protein n=1 Tax=Kineosphaera limosa NBRC 100340 TaxID=1184609 RepID=K6W966_9MICO|nr:hypothetical protein [Kineosphaera limosa]NYE00086.1 hypothetical protein [Kineosphaera limosa]GAB95740.1 hypothetical protein KILIM_026_00110 [Kineosphaera limosa NBRC 100340]
MSAEEVRELLIDELNPMAGACAVMIAHLIDAPDEPPATREDLLAMVTAAMESGRAPIGPLEYAEEEIDYGLRTNVPVASITTSADGQVSLRLALALSGNTCIGVGGNRYGYQPHLGGRVSPWTVLLPDVEAGLAELVVYIDERAKLMGYHGRVRATLELISAEPVHPGTIHGDSGRVVVGEPIEAFEPLTFEYSIDMPAQSLQSLVYEVATQVARRFGADEPQFLTRP